MRYKGFGLAQIRPKQPKKYLTKKNGRKTAPAVAVVGECKLFSDRFAKYGHNPNEVCAKGLKRFAQKGGIGLRKPMGQVSANLFYPLYKPFLVPFGAGRISIFEPCIFNDFLCLEWMIIWSGGRRTTFRSPTSPKPAVRGSVSTGFIP